MSPLVWNPKDLKKRFELRRTPEAALESFFRIALQARCIARPRSKAQRVWLKPDFASLLQPEAALTGDVGIRGIQNMWP